MGYIDYSRIGAPSYGKEISSLGDTLFAVMQHRAKVDAQNRAMDEQEKHDRALEDYQRTIGEATNRRLDQAEKRDDEKFANEKLDRSLKGANDIYTAIGEDDPARVALLEAAHGITDKTSNPFTPPERPVVPKDIGPQPQFVDAPAGTLEEAMAKARAAAPPATPGEMTTDDLEAQRANDRAEKARELFERQQAAFKDYNTQLEAYRGKNAGYQAELGSFNKREAEFPKQQRDYEEHTVHELTLQNGQTVGGIDVAKARYASRSKNAADMEAAVMPQLTAEMARARTLGGEMGAIAQAEVQRKISLFGEHKAAVFSGAEKPADAFKAWNADVRDQSHEARIVSENALNRTAKHEDVQTMANRPQASLSLGNARLGFDQVKDNETRLRTDRVNWQGVEAAKALKENYRTADQLVGKLASGEPGTVKNGLLELYKIAQSDTRMSDKDAVIANQVDASVISKVENWYKMGMHGLPGDLNIAAALDTAKRLRSFMHQKRDSLETDWKKNFVESGGYDSADADLLGSQMIPDYKRITGTATPDRRRPAAGGKSGGGRLSASGSAVTPKVQDAVDSAIDRIFGGGEK